MFKKSQAGSSKEGGVGGNFGGTADLKKRISLRSASENLRLVKPPVWGGEKD